MDLCVVDRNGLDGYLVKQPQKPSKNKVRNLINSKNALRYKTVKIPENSLSYILKIKSYAF